MRNKNDPASGKQNKFVSAHDLLLAGLTNPGAVVLKISAEDQGTIVSDNEKLHRLRTARDSAVGLARKATSEYRVALASAQKNYRAIRRRTTAGATYTAAIGLRIGFEHTQSVPTGATAATGPQPKLSGKPGNTGGALLKSSKGNAEAVDIYGQRKGDAGFVLLMRVLRFPWLDRRPLLVEGQPEARQYYAQFVRGDKPYGNRSATITVIVSA